jgi:hypothetical protein
MVFPGNRILEGLSVRTATGRFYHFLSSDAVAAVTRPGQFKLIGNARLPRGEADLFPEIMLDHLAFVWSLGAEISVV